MARGRKFVIKKAENGEPYFLLIASNGQVLMHSETYSSMAKLEQTLGTLVGIKLPEKVIYETVTG